VKTGLIRLQDNAGGEDTITVDRDSLDAVANDRPATPTRTGTSNIVYSGIDQFNVVDPGNQLTLVSDVAGQPIIMGPIGVGRRRDLGDAPSAAASREGIRSQQPPVFRDLAADWR
jgi:hypothetical protein